jgi:hypothetical protein
MAHCLGRAVVWNRSATVLGGEGAGRDRGFVKIENTRAIDRNVDPNGSVGRAGDGSLNVE